MTSICLNMIVKNEAHVIVRCLRSVKPHITSWCIVDTGSTDGTQEKIKAVMAGIPGELHEKPWVKQEHNRNEALDLAYATGADYIFLIDADEVLERASEDATWPALGCDWYTLNVRYGSIEYSRSQLLSTKHIWRWRSTGRRCGFHPMLTSASAKTCGRIEGLSTRPFPDGASWSDPDKYKRLLPLVELDLLDEPRNHRLWYYAAQTYRDAGGLQRALALYEARVRMLGWSEEMWSAAYEAAKLRERLGEPLDNVKAAYLRAYNLRPSRAEPLYRLARLHRLKGFHAEAATYAARGLMLPLTTDVLFVEHEIYAWLLHHEYVLSANSVARDVAGNTAAATVL